MKVLISKSDIEKNFEYIQERLFSDIEIDLTHKSAVIFGFNGIGKSSLYNYLKSTDKNNGNEYIEYEDSQLNFIQKKDKLKISPYISEIQEKEAMVGELTTKMNVKSIIKKQFDISTKGKAEIYGPKVTQARLDNKFDGFDSRVGDIDSVINNLKFINQKDFVELLPKLKEVVDIEEELNHAILEKTKNLLNDAIPIVFESGSNSCPLCNTYHEDLEKILKDNLKKLEDIKTKVYFDLEKRGYQPNEEQFLVLLEQAALLDEDSKLLQDYILCGGDIDIRKELSKSYRSIRKLNKEINEMKEKSEIKYLNLVENQEKIVDDFHKYFDVEKDNILFNDEEHVVEIKLPRHSKNYSTGEKNLMFFLYQIYSFIGSEKDVLIIDDPVSSLDIINHYKIAYELVKVANHDDKRVLILTHSVELMNTLNSQHNGCFNYYYLEEDDCLKLQSINVNSYNNLITLENINKNGGLESSVIDLLIVKENTKFRDPIHKVFHYYEEECFDEDKTLSNHDLVQKIENYTELTDTRCFLKNSKIKIETVAAIRVWLEKKLYDLIEDENVKESYLKKNTLMQRINYLLPRNGNYKIQLPNGLSRDYILSKKVFLNQGIHYQSQVMPFAYAINMSIGELNNQVKELRDRFKTS